MSLQKGQSTAIDFTGRTGDATTQIIAQDPGGTSIGLGRLTGGALGLYNICIGLRASQTNTGSNNVVIGVDAASETADAVSKSVIIGYAAGRTVALDANTFVGSQAGEKCSYGSMNCGFGNMSMNETANGWFNTAAGSESLLLNGNGNQNVAIGSQAMRNVSNSNSNTVCGYMAGYGNPSIQIAGDGNCIFGSKAGYNLSEVNNSIAIGPFASFENRRGDECISIGYQAGFSNVSATNLVTIGTKSAYSNIEGDLLAIGQMAATALISGTENTIVGHHAASICTSGTRNTYIGKLAGAISGNDNSSLGKSSLSNASVNSCVAIGAFSGQFSTGSNTLSVGFEAGSYSSGNECIYIGNGMGREETKNSSLAIGMSSPDNLRTPLISGNMDTAPGGKPGVKVRGNVSIEQNSILGDSFADNGLIIYRNDDTVNAAWHAYVDDSGNWVFGKNGQPAAVMEADISVPDVASLDFTGQHRCRPSPALMEMAKREKTILGLPIAGNIVVSSGTVCTAMGKKGEVYSGKQGIAVSQSLPCVDLSTRPKDKAVFGVVSGLETCTKDGQSRTYNTGSMIAVFQKEPGDDRLVINSLGEGAIWVCNCEYATVENGDYVTSSCLPGVAMKQKSDVLRNSTVAKLTVGCDFSLDSKLFECVEVIYMGITYRCALLACTFHCG